MRHETGDDQASQGDHATRDPNQHAVPEYTGRCLDARVQRGLRVGRGDQVALSCSPGAAPRSKVMANSFVNRSLA